MSNLLTVRETAEYLRLSTSKVYDMIAQRAIPYVRVGLGRGVIRLRRSDIDAWLEARVTHAAGTEQQEEAAGESQGVGEAS